VLFKFSDPRRLLMQKLHAVVAVALRQPRHRELLGIDLERGKSEPRVDVRHARCRLFDEVLEANEIQALLYRLGQIQYGVQ
jgi:hypothetical protein